MIQSLWLAGAAIGLAWVLIPVSAEETSQPYGALGGAVLVAWFVMRALGTIVLVPIIEELFFRDYLEGKLRGRAAPVLAAVGSAVLFAALHDRWAEACVAGLVF